MVRMLSVAGVTQIQICRLILNPETGKPIDRGTLTRHFSEELDTALMDMTGRVIGKLYAIAMQDEDLRVASSACMFFLKTRAGWREKDPAPPPYIVDARESSPEIDPAKMNENGSFDKLDENDLARLYRATLDGTRSVH